MAPLSGSTVLTPPAKHSPTNRESVAFENSPHNMKYENRTPESIKQELDECTEDGVKQLARFLQGWMANEHNARDFESLAEDQGLGTPANRVRIILGHALDWFAYGN